VRLPDRLIDYLHSLLTEKIQLYSCFISYSSNDEDSAHRLHATYLVLTKSDIRTAADADRSGIRIALVRNNPTDLHLTNTIRNAELVRAENEQASVDLVRSGRADVMALARCNVPGRLRLLPGHRSLDENFAGQPVALSLQKGRRAALACLEEFVRQGLLTGFVWEAISRSGHVGIALPKAP
jgi:polar amino acid transport system substrate-binding protein